MDWLGQTQAHYNLVITALILRYWSGEMTDMASDRVQVRLGWKVTWKFVIISTRYPHGPPFWWHEYEPTSVLRLCRLTRLLSNFLRENKAGSCFAPCVRVITQFTSTFRFKVFCLLLTLKSFDFELVQTCQKLPVT